jgi:hypothetical protein
MAGWVWLARVKRWIGCGDMQDGLLQHYQQMVPLSDWDIERRVREAPYADDYDDLCRLIAEERVQCRDSEDERPSEG